MINNETSEPEAGYPSPMAEKTRRVTRSYQAELLDLQTRVNAGLKLLSGVKVEKNSQDIMAAVMDLLRAVK